MNDLPQPLVPCNPVHDPVHGRVWLTEVELELVNTPELQRLRRISQLAPVDLVFPGATHNRFAHSIGAMHVMGWILGQRELQNHFSARPCMIQILRLAALLHDVGHLPFSHVGELAWNVTDTPGWSNYVEDRVCTPLDVVVAGSTGQLHERLSAQLVERGPIAEIVNRHIPDTFHDGVKTQTAAEIVARIIKGDPLGTGEDDDVLIHNLVSSELDCDRLDYLVRDSQAAGLTYGGIDLSYLIGNLVIARDQDVGTLLAIDRHGLVAGEHYLLSRYYHYAQLIGHKAVGAAEICLAAAILEMLRLEALPGVKEIESWIVDPARDGWRFMELTDDAVMSSLARAPREHGGHDMLVECARRVSERKLLKAAAHDDSLEKIKRAGDSAVHVWDARLPKNRLSAKLEVARECDVDPTYFVYSRTTRLLSGIDPDTSVDAAVRDANKMQAQWTKAAKVVSPDGEPRLLVEASPVLRELSTRQWSTRRVFARESLDSYTHAGQGRRSPEFERLKRFFSERLEEQGG